MSKRPVTTAPTLAQLEVHAIPEAIRKLARRRDEIQSVVLPPGCDVAAMFAIAKSLCTKLDQTLIEVFGQNSKQYEDCRIGAMEFHGNMAFFSAPSPQKVAALFKAGQDKAVLKINTQIGMLEERAADIGQGSGSRNVLGAYEGLDLHPTIADAATDLFKNGHYSHAILDATIALTNLVRLKSGQEGDGATFMESVFSAKNPILRFNELRDESDMNEQKGFMLLFSGAITCLRNPRAHKLIEDEAERALEFIAFISLLAKLLDGAKKVPRNMGDKK